MYQELELPIRSRISASHDAAIAAYAEPGTWLTSDLRLQILAEARAAIDCELCRTRSTALSPYSVKGDHDQVTSLSDDMLEVVHRICTDSGRITRSWFDDITSRDLTPEMYIEIVGLVATSIILDSFATGVGAELAPPPDEIPGEPSREKNSQVIEAGAWVPLLDVEQEPTDLAIPTAPNIFRAMGLVPGAIAHFFGVMRSQYSLTDYEISINRSQIELIASRVSALNQCFY